MPTGLRALTSAGCVFLSLQEALVSQPNNPVSSKQKWCSQGTAVACIPQILSQLNGEE